MEGNLKGEGRLGSCPNKKTYAFPQKPDLETDGLRQQEGFKVGNQKYFQRQSIAKTIPGQVTKERNVT